MKINLNEILYAVSFAFDATEAEYYERIRNNGIHFRICIGSTKTENQ